MKIKNKKIILLGAISSIPLIVGTSLVISQKQNKVKKIFANKSMEDPETNYFKMSKESISNVEKITGYKYKGTEDKDVWGLKTYKYVFTSPDEKKTLSITKNNIMLSSSNGLYSSEWMPIEWLGPLSKLLSQD